MNIHYIWQQLWDELPTQPSLLYYLRGQIEPRLWFHKYLHLTRYLTKHMIWSGMNSLMWLNMFLLFTGSSHWNVNVNDVILFAVVLSNNLLGQIIMIKKWIKNYLYVDNKSSCLLFVNTNRDSHNLQQSTKYI